MYLPNSASTFPAPVYVYAMPKCLFNMSKQVLYTVPATPTILHVARTDLTDSIIIFLFHFSLHKNYFKKKNRKWINFDAHLL